MNYDFDFSATLDNLPYLVRGAGLTLVIAFVSFWLGAAIGLLGALGKTHGGKGLRRAIDGYVIFMTNTPALVQLYFIFYGLPSVGVTLAPLTAVLIGLVLNSGAYLTEIIRAGVLSIPKSETEATEVLGLTRLQSVRYIVVPHVLRTVYAPLVNFFVLLVLGSSMAALFGVEELTGRAINVSTTNLRTIETFLIVALIYVGLTLCAQLTLTAVGRRSLPRMSVERRAYV
jgi:polar amino acid transport system permease protein